MPATKPWRASSCPAPVGEGWPLLPKWWLIGRIPGERSAGRRRQPYGAVVTYLAPQRRPPSKFLALWISLPIMALVALCGGISAALDDEDDAGGKPQPVASVSGLPSSSSVAASDAARTPSTTPTSSPAPSTAAPTTTSPPAGRTTTTTRPAPPPATRTTAPSTPPSVYYANCDAVRAAGKAPLYRGQPGYRAGLDRDDDGVACE